MPINIDPTWHLANPIPALLLGLLVMLLVGLATGIRPWSKSWPKERRANYKKKMALAAEVLVSVGIIGLLTFSARVKMASEIDESDRLAQDLRHEFNVQYWALAQSHCTGVSPLPPTREAATYQDMCQWLPRLITAPGEPIDWINASKDFDAMAQAVRDNAPLAGQYRGLAASMLAVWRQEDVAARQIHARKIVEHDVSWVFIAWCVFFAMAGIGLKLARAVLDVWRD